MGCVARKRSRRRGADRRVPLWGFDLGRLLSKLYGLLLRIVTIRFLPVVWIDYSPPTAYVDPVDVLCVQRN
jgi:hypothetical protein